MRESRTPALVNGIRCYDVRTEQLPAGPPKAALVWRGLIVKRPIAVVDSICLHQTAVNFGVSPAQIHAAGGDLDLAQFMRAKLVHAHITAFDEGAFVVAFDLLDYVWHGNGANLRSVGLEEEGFFNGEPGGKTNAEPNKKRSEPSSLLIETSRAACTFICEELSRRGGNPRHYLAHRQYAASRRSDPGWMLWKEVGIEHCEKRLGLSPLPDLTDRDGLPIPSSWDSRFSHPY